MFFGERERQRASEADETLEDRDRRLENQRKQRRRQDNETLEDIDRRLNK